jgi:hypothetical protein
MFFKAQKLIAPDQIAFAIRSNPQAIKLCKAGVYKHWMAQLMFGTVGVAAAQLEAAYIGPDGRGTVSGGIDSAPAPQKPNIFFQQRMFFWKGRFYMREDVVKMHANTVGGVHLDFRKAADEAHIREIKNYLGFEVKGKNIRMLIGEEINELRADSTRRQSVYDATELVAIDTARIFASGIRAAEQAFRKLLAD